MLAPTRTWTSRARGARKAFYAELRPTPPPRGHERLRGGADGQPQPLMSTASHPVPGSEGDVVLPSYSWADDASRWDSMSDDER